MSEVHVRPHRPDPRGTTVTVIAGVIDVLHIDRVEHAAPGMPVVIAFDNILPPVVEISIAQQESQSAQLQILLMIALDGIGDEGDCDLIHGPVPARPGVIQARNIQ